jgi:hypothetical protein
VCLAGRRSDAFEVGIVAQHGEAARFGRRRDDQVRDRQPVLTQSATVHWTSRAGSNTTTRARPGGTSGHASAGVVQDGRSMR